MRIWIICAALAALGLSGCNKPADGRSGLLITPHGKGRYFGLGLYPVGRMWTQVVGAAAVKDPAAAQPADDEQIVVVLDSATGEVRQCGNLSGACIAMKPWDGPLAASRASPVLLAKHAEQVRAEEEAAFRQQQADAKTEADKRKTARGAPPVRTR